MFYLYRIGGIQEASTFFSSGYSTLCEIFQKLGIHAVQQVRVTSTKLFGYVRKKW